MTEVSRRLGDVLGTRARGRHDVRRGLVQVDGAAVQVQLDLRERSVGGRVLKKEGKGMLLYSVVSRPLDRSKRFTLFLPWHYNETCSLRHQLEFSGKHSSHAAITRNDYSPTFPSITRYSFIQLSEQGRQWRERKCSNFETVAKGDPNPGSLDCESGVLPLSYRSPRRWDHTYVIRLLLPRCSHELLDTLLCVKNVVDPKIMTLCDFPYSPKYIQDWVVVNLQFAERFWVGQFSM